MRISRRWRLVVAGQRLDERPNAAVASDEVRSFRGSVLVKRVAIDLEFFGSGEAKTQIVLVIVSHRLP